MNKLIKVPNEVLHIKSEPVAPTEDIDRILYYMSKVLKQANGIGLAAAQIGVNKQIFIMSPPEPFRKSRRIVVFLNPKISQELYPYDVDEGCLSIPGEQHKVKRYGSIRLEADMYLNRNFREKIDEVFTGMLAQIIQHEVDHLRGKLINDASTTI